MNINTTALVVFLLAALWIALSARKITWHQFTWRAVHSIALGMFLVGRML